MSRIAAILNLDGAPVDPGLLHRLSAQMEREDHSATVWADGSVGLGHVPLRTTSESVGEQQPDTVDGRVWITADARIDAREELIEALISARPGHAETHTDLLTAPDDQLILHAYGAWQERCLDHLLGDFAFALWDGHRRQLFCARDQLGVKPLFYARTGQCLVIGSELRCVRAHPAVSDDLDDLAVADFLLWGQQQRLEATPFAAVRRLPPAHRMTALRDVVDVRRYWRLTPHEEVRYSRDYVERFSELLEMAVRDRVRTDRVGALMSGGVDSPLVAATARMAGAHVRAFTVVYEDLIPDQEGPNARIAAEALGIPIEFLAGDGYHLFANWDEPGMDAPEPRSDPTSAIGIDVMRRLTRHSRVALTGFDGDALCQVWLAAHFRGLVRSLHLKRAVKDAVSYAWHQRSPPPIGFRTWLADRGHSPATPFPPWIRPELIAEFDLRSRWEALNTPRRPVDRHVRADAIELLTSPTMSWLFDNYDPAATGCGVDVRHPLLDLRIVDFVLSVPPVPWCLDKMIIRRSATDLPASIRNRPKAALAEDPVAVRFRGQATLDNPPFAPEMAKYVISDALPSMGEIAGSSLLWPRLWAASLNRWLQSGGRSA